MVSQVQVIPLRCSHCGNPLLGLDNDRVFFCTTCVQGNEWRGGMWEVRELHYAEAGVPGRNMQRIYLPFWRFKVELIAEAVNEKQQRIIDLFERLDTIWVAGFSMIRAAYFGDPGLLYTEAEVDLQEDPQLLRQDLPRVAGCTRGIVEAKTLVELYLLMLIDRRADITGLELSPLIHDASIWAVPYFDMGNKVIDSITQKEYPALCIDDLEGMRKPPAR